MFCAVEDLELWLSLLLGEGQTEEREPDEQDVEEEGNEVWDDISVGTRSVLHTITEYMRFGFERDEVDAVVVLVVADDALDAAHGEELHLLEVEDVRDELVFVFFIDAVEDEDVEEALYAVEGNECDEQENVPFPVAQLIAERPVKRHHCVQVHALHPVATAHFFRVWH